MKALIGLEVHVELATGRKLFCHCASIFGSPVNANTCPYCIRREGMPSLDEGAVDIAALTALALEMDVPPVSRFVRKVNASRYLPGGYQITQAEEPLARDGSFRGVHIDRLQLEEDAARPVMRGETDYNRAGLPLIEIITAPELQGGEQARRWVEELRLALRFLGVTDGRVEQGSLRCDVNVSLEGGAYVEIKGLASLRAVQAAADAEIQRQRGVLERGGVIERAVLHWSERNKVLTFSEQAYGYAFAPAYDLPAIAMPPGKIERIRAGIGETPSACADRLISAGVESQDAYRIARHRGAAGFLDAALRFDAPVKEAARLIVGEVFRSLSTEDAREAWATPITPSFLARVAQMLHEGAIDADAAKSSLARALDGGGEIELAPGAATDRQEILVLAQDAIDALPGAAQAYRAGKDRALSALLGWMMGQKQVGAKEARACLLELINT